MTEKEAGSLDLRERLEAGRVDDLLAVVLEGQEVDVYTEVEESPEILKYLLALQMRALAKSMDTDVRTLAHEAVDAHQKIDDFGGTDFEKV